MTAQPRCAAFDLIENSGVFSNALQCNQPSFKSVDCPFTKCCGDCGNQMAKIIELCNNYRVQYALISA